ncbi:hypothetical protein NDU88_005704 [Pleurodeles waltl]|uniref:Uncharacterized protein n=1 Tax=Pleurodeles waltl TaxID=8319 RepID=A0AAV7QHW8_PLEWA|nr:hypothetical protein NDU88_005704 [Pleurodeles waltl]
MGTERRVGAQTGTSFTHAYSELSVDHTRAQSCVQLADTQLFTKRHFTDTRSSDSLPTFVCVRSLYFSLTNTEEEPQALRVQFTQCTYAPLPHSKEQQEEQLPGAGSDSRCCPRSSLQQSHLLICTAISDSGLSELNKGVRSPSAGRAGRGGGQRLDTSSGQAVIISPLPRNTCFYEANGAPSLRIHRHQMRHSFLENKGAGPSVHDGQLG